MKAIIQIGGPEGSPQYTVEEGALVDVQLLQEQAGSVITFDQVLSVITPEKTLVGQPFVEGCRVLGEIVSNDISGEKVRLMKYEPRHHNRGSRGHRQKYTRVKITSIVL